MTYEEACSKCGIEPVPTTEESERLFVDSVASLVDVGDDDQRHYNLIGVQFEMFG